MCTRQTTVDIAVDRENGRGATFKHSGVGLCASILVKTFVLVLRIEETHCSEENYVRILSNGLMDKMKLMGGGSRGFVSRGEDLDVQLR